MDDDQGKGKKSDFVEGSTFLLWENSLERLKIINYEINFLKPKRKKPFTRTHFTMAGKNQSHQFDDFVDLCAWLLSQITDSDMLKREQYDDPNTVSNKLLLALRQVDFQANFPVQKLKVPFGDVVCEILDFLTEKALAKKSFTWKRPNYSTLDSMNQGGADDNDEDAADNNSEIEDIFEFDEDHNTSSSAIDDHHHHNHSTDHIITNKNNNTTNTTHSTTTTNGISSSGCNTNNGLDPHYTSNIISGFIDANEWKIELERVTPKLKSSSQYRSGSEWRNHIVQIMDNAKNIDTVVQTNTKNDLAITTKNLTDEMTRLSNREQSLNNQYPSIHHTYKEIKVQLDEYIKKSTSTNDSIQKLSKELTEITEKIEEYKEQLDSKDSGINDTSPLVRIKSALQQIKSEISTFDLRIGVVTHSLLTAKHNAIKSTRAQVIKNNKLKNKKNLRKDNMLETSTTSLDDGLE